MKYKKNDEVRIFDYPEDDINGYAIIRCIYPDGSIWLVNTNMPYIGTINSVFSEKEFKRMIQIKMQG